MRVWRRAAASAEFPVGNELALLLRYDSSQTDPSATLLRVASENRQSHAFLASCSLRDAIVRERPRHLPADDVSVTPTKLSSGLESYSEETAIETSEQITVCHIRKL